MKKQINPTIKAQIIRSAFYLLLLLAVCAIPFALAQSRSRGTTKRAQAASMSQLPTTSNVAAAASAIRLPVNLPVPAAPASVLYDQYNNASTTATLSATFTDFPTFSSDLADDFVVPPSQTWTVQSIDADGLYFNGPGPAASFNVFFYSDSGGLPGAPVYSATSQPFSVVGTTFTVNLPAPAVLTAGHYWVEIQANMTFGTGGEWGSTDRTVLSNYPAAWQNPGGGFGICPTWMPKLASCITTAGGPDQVFRLNGTAAPCPTYTFSSSTRTFVPGVTNIGNSCDDCSTVRYASIPGDPLWQHLHDCHRRVERLPVIRNRLRQL